MELLERASRFNFNFPNNLPVFVCPSYKNDIFYVEKKSQNKWCICYYTESIYSKNKQTFIYGRMPSNRSDNFINDTRFDLEEAIQIAESIEKGEIIPFRKE